MVLGGCDQWQNKLIALRNKEQSTYEARYQHDHYVEKVTQMILDRDTRTQAGTPETPAQHQALERNEEKMRKATADYDVIRNKIVEVRV